MAWIPHLASKGIMPVFNMENNRKCPSRLDLALGMSTVCKQLACFTAQAEPAFKQRKLLSLVICQHLIPASSGLAVLFLPLPPSQLKRDRDRRQTKPKNPCTVSHPARNDIENGVDHSYQSLSLYNFMTSSKKKKKTHLTQ